MDIVAIRKFFDYEQTPDADPQFLVDNIIEQASHYLSPDQLPKIQHAYEFARDSHDDQLRLSGEPYIVHPVKATLYLMDIKPDLPSIQTCLLHDVIEDTPVTYEDIKKEFGEEVAELCEGLVKVSTIRYKGEDRQIETLKKTFLAMAKDLRVIFIKIADRIHNIQTLDYHPKEEKRKKIALETMKIYAPIAKKLGLFHYHTFLENGAFKHLEPKEFHRIVDYITKKFSNDKHIEKGVKTLEKILDKESISYNNITGRLKSPYRIHQKMRHKYHTNDFSKIMDILAFRVITHNVGDCYNTLGIIHNYYTPLIHKIKDYIAVPKFNGYQSIHTTVLGLFNFPVEIQIRTQTMDEVAEFGVAAHFAYTETGGSTLVSAKQSDWITRLQDLVKTYQTEDKKEDFKTELDIEILERNNFIYTPQGDIIELPAGATVLDFAFRIHTDIGLKFKNAIINGSIKPIGHKPKTGDVIQINTFRNKYSATQSWLEYLHTPTARSKLIRHLKQHNRTELIKAGYRMINKKLLSYQLPELSDSSNKISSTYKKTELEERVIRVFQGHESPTDLIRTVYDHEVSLHLTQKKKQKTKHPKTTTANSIPRQRIVIDETQYMTYSIVGELSPNKKTKIIAKADKTGMKIHSTENQAIMRTLSFGKLYEAHREGNEPNTYTISIGIKMIQNPTNLMKVMSLYDELRINVVSIIVEQIDTKTSELIITCQTRYPIKLAHLTQTIKKNQNFLKISTKSIE